MSKDRYPSKMTLREHLDGLDQNSRAGSEELLSLHKRVKKKFKELGYVNTAKNDTLITKYIRMILRPKITDVHTGCKRKRANSMACGTDRGQATVFEKDQGTL